MKTLSLFFILALSADADLLVTNGTFTGDGTFVSDEVGGWFESTAPQSPRYEEFLINSSNFLNPGDEKLAFGEPSGYVYQSLGARASEKAGLFLTFDAFKRSLDRGFSDLVFEVYQGDFSGAAEEVDIQGQPSVTLVGSVTVTSADLGFSTNQAIAEEVLAYTTTTAIDLSGVPTGTEVWLRVSSPGAATGFGVDEAFIDNLTLSFADLVTSPSDGQGLCLVSYDSGNASLSWSSEAGATYTLESSPDLTNWTEVSNAIPSGGIETVFNDDLSARLGTVPRKLFYRVFAN